MLVPNRRSLIAGGAGSGRQFGEARELALERLVEPPPDGVGAFVQFGGLVLGLEALAGRDAGVAGLVDVLPDAGPDAGEQGDSVGGAFLDVDAGDLGAENVGNQLAP